MLFTKVCFYCYNIIVLPFAVSYIKFIHSNPGFLKKTLPSFSLDMSVVIKKRVDCLQSTVRKYFSHNPV